MENNTPQWRKEFPGYPADAMPAIPAEWIDVSWHNDTCPRFNIMTDEAGSNFTHMYIWIEYPNPNEREMGPDSPRFIVWVYNEASSTDQVLLTTNEWADVIAYLTPRLALGNEYKEAVGYNPFLDDPTLSPNAVNETLIEYRKESNP